LEGGRAYAALPASHAVVSQQHIRLSQVFDVGCCSDKGSGDDDLSSKRTAAGAMCQRANVATGDYSFISLASLPDKFPFAKLSLIITPITTGSVPYIGRHRSI